MKAFLLCSFVLLAQAGAGLSVGQPIRVNTAAPELLGSNWLNTPIANQSRWRRGEVQMAQLIEDLLMEAK